MKKKKNLNPLELDKETIAKLDEKQLESLAGGKNDPDEQDEATCFLTNIRISLRKCGDESLDREGGCCNTTVIAE
ncbi:class I lanthipeptide [Marivirga arenosa]|jgi:hypothetical protein|uniref:Class I lanthipeptide n=1 Tax=Marivirga arenosa TaxID=3059076 RepID=A0AA49J9L3_9BACT|nr:class I lanthipeptide [Marivirga sp. BKB1-2]WKK81751.1 class I lanthipeptide [Marivirga sp. BKB1-2]